MAVQEPKIGDLYRHFKGRLYQVTNLAKDADTGERVVVYQALYGDYETYVRPYEEFVSEVDYEKYPEVTAQYRFTPVARGSRAARAEEPLVRVSSGDDAGSQDSPAERAASDEDDIRAEVSDNGVATASVTPARKPPHRRSAISGIDPHTGVSRRMLAFLDSDDMDEKYELLTDMMVEGELNDQIIDNLAASLDVVIPEGSLDDRYDQLRICIRTRARYELQRLR